MTYPEKQNAPWPVVARPGAVPNNDRQENNMIGNKTKPNPTGQLATAASTPEQPPVTAVTDDARQTGINANLANHSNHGTLAVKHERNVRRLNTELQQAQQEYDQLRARLEALSSQIRRATEERDREALLGRQERDNEDLFARVVVSLGGALPAPARNVPDGLGGEAWEPCPRCGQPMQWDRQRNSYVHPIEGGFELAGESCRRPLAEGQDAAEGVRS